MRVIATTNRSAVIPITLRLGNKQTKGMDVIDAATSMLTEMIFGHKSEFMHPQKVRIFAKECKIRGWDRSRRKRIFKTFRAGDYPKLSEEDMDVASSTLL